jgi:DNA polymerase/3'-5' exonuclease PolX
MIRNLKQNPTKETKTSLPSLPSVQSLSAPDKKRYPHADALAVANELIAALQYGCGPACERIEIAGSIRRAKPMVGDIELIYIPRFERRQVAPELFPRLADLADLALEKLLRDGILAKRPNKNGGTAWGRQNKLAVHVASGIPVDLFATEADCWFNYLVCRTGGAETNKAICNAAIAKGWKWNPYGRGFTERDGIGVHYVKTERDVFDFVGLPYLAPEERT